MNILRGWKDLPKHILLKAFEAGNFAGVEEMRRNDRLFERVAPMGVNDIMMAVQYRCGEPCLAAQAGSLHAHRLSSRHTPACACPPVHPVLTPAPPPALPLQLRGAAAPDRACACV